MRNFEELDKRIMEDEKIRAEKIKKRDEERKKEYAGKNPKTITLVKKFMKDNLPKHEIFDIKKEGEKIKVTVFVYGNNEHVDEYVLEKDITRRGRKIVRFSRD